MDLPEVLVISATGNPNNNCSIYDMKDGNELATFKGGYSARNGLCFIGQDYLLSAFKNSSTLSVWTLTPNGAGKQMTVPGMVSCCLATSDGRYCFAGIEKSIYVWETASGALLTVLQYHSQEVTCLQITCDSSYFLSGGMDGQVLVWPLVQIVAENDITDSIRPHFTWNDHAAEVTDIHVTDLSFHARVATSSKDMTCRIYELDSGTLLTTIRVDFAINAVTMDGSEYFLFLGSMEGEIYRINLFAGKEAEVHYNKSDLQCTFIGHTKAITCLSVSTSGKYLVSGSEDHDCRLWDLRNFTIVRKLSHKGPVTNAFITCKPPGFKSEKTFSPSVALKLFKKEYEPSQHALSSVTTTIQDKKLSLMMLGSPDEFFDSQALINPAQLHDGALKTFNMEGMNLANSQMYSFALCETVHLAFHSQPKSTEESD